MEVEKNRSVKIEVEAAKVKPFVVVGRPAFNEEKTIARVVVTAQDHADKVVVCDDGSSDLTGEIALRLGADVVRHERNLGYGAAVQSLFRRARELGADVLVTLDADGQHDPCEVPNVMKPIVDGVADVVIGSRFVGEWAAYAMPWYRRAGVKFITRLVNNSGKHAVRDAQSGFRAYNCESLEKLTLLENGMGVSVEVLVNARQQGLRIQEVPATCNYSRDVKNSTHNPIRHGVSVVMSIVRLVVEERPLVFLGIPGVVSLLVGVLFGVWMLQIYALERQIMTNVALASIAFILIGLFCVFTAITLYAISRLMQKTNNKH
ncbi:glycosyltransferase family 2 protein [Candidatus Bathyarchaeota archaeon]|nr:glycosyltransferase family 2 protein [Candidatus Bathyarchaeota archaeon]